MRGFWLQKCVRDFKFSKNLLHSLGEEEDFRRLYIKRPYERNLMKNCDASQDMKHWKVTKSGGDGWQVEKSPIGLHPLSQLTHTDGPVGCWATSYGSCHKYQIIDLLEVGCSEHVLDVVRPSIRVSEWYAARVDCAAKYVLKVALLKNNKKELFWKKTITENCLYVAKEILSAGGDWFKAEHVFKDYPAGVRYIGFFHKGKDRQFWAGHFGAKFTFGSVVIDFSHTALTE
ncbi:F-box only protein 6-like isoform X2 [Dreissena polymorpha]|nr:F-box only protein 6-like isoform X2 [Dreissena polymorpha]